MSSAALTIKVFGTYIIVSALGLALMPNVFLAPFGFPPAHESWVRVVGVLAGVLGFYYWACALADARPFFVASVYGRGIFCAGCVALVLLAGAPWQLVFFGFIDLAGAIWTKVALDRDAPVLPADGPRAGR